MNDLCADIGYGSLNKYGEELCGDHVDVAEAADGLAVVLADGLGSGVKASILSTLTSKIISTMIAEDIALDECVSTIAATLPVCAERGVAYSTFTILRIRNNEYAEIIEYDNPSVIFARAGKNAPLTRTASEVGGKTIYHSSVALQEGDLFLAVSDGAIHASTGMTLDLSWNIDSIAAYMQDLYDVGFTAKTLATILLDQCYERYGGQPGDDVTACAVRIRKRVPASLLIGPPSDPDDCDKMMSLFFGKCGKHIVCGGTTSSIAARYLGKEMTPELRSDDPSVPPISYIDGVDLVTEGVLTMNKVLSYAQDFLGENQSYAYWSERKDGASQIARILFEEATDIDFFVGQAVNPAHQAAGMPINFSVKMRLVSQLADCLRKMGKRIKVSYF